VPDQETAGRGPDLQGGGVLGAGLAARAPAPTEVRERPLAPGGGLGPGPAAPSHINMLRAYGVQEDKLVPCKGAEVMQFDGYRSR
jgi:hypothetical protein